MNCGAKVLEDGCVFAREFPLGRVPLPPELPSSVEIADIDWFRPCPGDWDPERGDEIKADLGLEPPFGEPADGDGVLRAKGLPRQDEDVDVAIVVGLCFCPESQTSDNK